MSGSTREATWRPRCRPRTDRGTEAVAREPSRWPLAATSPVRQVPSSEGKAAIVVPVMIRGARSADIPLMQEIEVAAGELFADLGMDLVAGDDPLPRATLGDFVDAGRCWVAVTDDGRPVGYLLVESVDGSAHIEQVSVHPDHGRRGVGTALIDRAAQWARAHGLPAVTLTTFVCVPWNAPYYRRLGFEALTVSDETPGLKAIRAQEKSDGLDQWPRVCMRRES